MPVTDIAQRGARVARRLIRGVRRGRPATGSAGSTSSMGSTVPEPQDVTAELARREGQLRAVRRKLRARETEVERLRAELKQTRVSVRDPDPDLPLPAAVTETIDRVRAEHLSYLQAADLGMLARLVVGLDAAQRPGLVVEAGTARGGSAIVMAAAKSAQRRMLVYDVFGLIPPPSDKDGEDVHQRYQLITSGKSRGVGGDIYYGYRDDLYAEVTESFTRHGVEAAGHGVELVQGLFADTIHLDEPVALAHLDGDWYESTLTCLERIAPLLVPGGRIVLDDYYAWSGCATAVDEYFAGRTDYRIERRAKVHVVRL